jgi:hypothetical protein
VKKNRKLNINKKKLNFEISKDIYLSKEDNIEKNVLNLLKNKDNPRK